MAHEPNESRPLPIFLRWPFQVSLAVAYRAIGFGAGIYWAHRTSQTPSSCFTVETKLRPPTHDLCGDEAACAIDSCIVGTVSNNCERTFRAAFLDFNLFDNSDVQIGTAQGLVQDLEPSTEARFTAPITGNVKVKKLKLVRITVEH